MSYQNIETLDGKISSIVKGLNNENSLEILKEAPTINKSYKTLESLVKNNMPSSPINHFLKNSLKTILYQIYAHPIMLSTILSQCRVGEYPKMGLLESLRQIKSEKGLRGLYTGVFPSILSMLATHASETAITYSLLKIFDSSLNVIKSSFSDYAENQMNPMNGGDQNNNNLTKLNLQKESIEKIRKLFRWILLLIVTPLIRVLVKQPLDVITANTIKESFQGANKNENMLFLYQMYRTIRNIFKEKGIRGFYAGTFSSTWSSFFTSIFMIVPLPYFGVSSNSKSILNLIFGQFLEYSFFTTKLRMATQPSPTSESSNLLPSGALSSFSHIVSREGWSSLLSGVSKYVFLSPIVALQYYFNSKEKTNTQTPNLFDLFAPNNLDQSYAKMQTPF